MLRLLKIRIKYSTNKIFKELHYSKNMDIYDTNVETPRELIVFCFLCFLFEVLNC